MLHEVIASIYRTHPNGWDANIMVKWSHKCPWKAIAQGFHLFIHHTRFVVGKGEKIRFWDDGRVTNLFVHNTLIFIELFFQEILPFQWFLALLLLPL